MDELKNYNALCKKYNYIRGQLDDYKKVIKIAADALDKKHFPLMITSEQHGLLKPVTRAPSMNTKSIRSESWPTAEKLNELLVEYHNVIHELQSAHAALGGDQPALATPWK